MAAVHRPVADLFVLGLAGMPLTLLFSIVYKSSKCDDVRKIPRAALGITFWILLGMSAAAVVLTIIVKVQE